MAPNYVIEPLGDQHDRAAFLCGVDPLDRYIHKQAGQEMRRHVAAVFVLRTIESSAVVGYYTLSATSILPSGLPPSVTKRLPRYPSLPALLIGRLAVDQHHHEQGLGELLLTGALRRSLLLRAELGAVAVVVDAKDDRARQFYEKYDFQRFVDHEYRLYMLTQTIEQLFQ